MCTSPITVKNTYKGNFSTKFYTVPCGKCSECRAKQQSEFAALSVLEAEASGSLAFFTLTYNDENIPIAYSRRFKLSVIRDSLKRGLDDSFVSHSKCCAVKVGEEFLDNNTSGVPDVIERFACPSLAREDVQRLIKRYRQDYFRRHGERLDFRFSFFGEYGEQFHRPHYHLLVYGLEKKECQRLCKLWRYGFSDLQFVSHFNRDGSDAFIKVSRYISKYIAKKEFLPDFVKDGFAEPPRKQSSIGLGTRSLDVEKLRNFTSPAMLARLVPMLTVYNVL